MTRESIKQAAELGQESSGSITSDLGWAEIVLRAIREDHAEAFDMDRVESFIEDVREQQEALSMVDDVNLADPSDMAAEADVKSMRELTEAVWTFILDSLSEE